MRIMGIDYGTRRLGVAVSDDTGMIAFPEAVLPQGNAAVAALDDLIRARSIGVIVVGHSLDLKGKENPLMDDIKIFIAKLEETFHLPVHLEPEFLSSVEARRGGTRADMVDASAAALILQRFLEKQRRSG